jgi:hypothetical protein
MPHPKKGEKRGDYVGRAIPIIKSEHPELSQRAVVGRAYGMFDFYKKKKRHRKPLTEG